MLLYEFPVLAVCAGEVLYHTISAEYEQMVCKPVEEMSVVGDDDKCPVEFLQVFFKYVQGDNVKVVGRFIHDEHIGLLHQNGQQVQPAFLSSAQLFDLVVEHVMREEESSEQACVVYNVEHSVFRGESDAFLPVISYLQ